MYQLIIDTPFFCLAASTRHSQGALNRIKLKCWGEHLGMPLLHSGAGVEGSKKRSCGIGSLPGRLKGNPAVSFVGAVFVELAEAHRQVTFPSLTGIGRWPGFRNFCFFEPPTPAPECRTVPLTQPFNAKLFLSGQDSCISFKHHSFWKGNVYDILRTIRNFIRNRECRNGQVVPVG